MHMIASVLVEHINAIRTSTNKEEKLRCLLAEADVGAKISTLVREVGEPPNSDAIAMAIVSNVSDLDLLGSHLFKAIRKAQDPWTLRRFVLALGWAYCETSKVALVDLLGHQEPELRALSVFVLGQVALSANLHSLIQTLSDIDESVRQMAVFVLGWSGGDLLAKALGKLVSERRFEDPYALVPCVLAHIGTPLALDISEAIRAKSGLYLTNPAPILCGNIEAQEMSDCTVTVLPDLQNATDQNIFLVGFSTSGKSSLSHSISRRLGWSAVDTDALLVAQEGTPIPELISTLGEERFRHLEAKLLADLCERLCVPTVVATGGGAPLSRANRILMQQAGGTVFLEISSSEVIRRLQALQNAAPANKHPTINLLDLGSERNIDLLLDFRKPYYELADLWVNVVNRSKESVTDEIVCRLPSV